jgi:hypothetical protein
MGVWIAASLAGALGVCGCGGGSINASGLPADERPIPAGRGSAYRLPAVSPAVARRATVAGLRCLRAHPPSYGVHLELYARRLVLPVPAGIGVAPPQHRRGVYVLGGSCSYAVRTFEPTGVIVVDRGRTPALAALFALLGQPLSGHTLAGFRGRVLAFVDGRAWHQAPGAIPLLRHAEIVLEIGGALAPHREYRFPPGL